MGMTVSYGMGQKLDNHESSNVTKFNSCKMLKKDVHSWMISVRTCWAIAAAIVLTSMVCPSLATAATSNDKHDATLIAFPRVGRSISDDEYYMMKKESGEKDESEPSLSNFPSSFEVPIPSLAGSKSRKRSKRQALIPFPRTGKRASMIPFPRTGKRAAMLVFPRTGKRASLIAMPRTGKRLYAPRTGKRASLIAMPRTGKRSPTPMFDAFERIERSKQLRDEP